MSQLADDVIRFIEHYCRVPEGIHAGQPIRLRQWQKDIIRQIYSDPQARRVIFSCGRKNGKTLLAALLLLAHLCGPAARRNSQVYSTALSRDQAALVYDMCAKIVRANPVLNAICTLRDSRKEIAAQKTGCTYRALSADAATNFGRSAAFVVHDELGQTRGSRSELYEAVETGMSAHESPLSVIISTQSPNDQDLLSVLIDTAEADSRTRLILYTAGAELPTFSDEAIRAANPSFDDFQNAEELRSIARDAERMPARQAEYENLILNRRVSARASFVSPEVWKACAAPVKPLEDVPVYAGLDLAVVQDLCAFQAIGRVDGILQVHSTFWLPEHGLREKARADRVPYDLWHQQGYLTAVPGKAVDYEYIARHLFQFCQHHDVQKVAFDRWGMGHLRPCLIRAGFGEAWIDEHMVPFGQGYASMTGALRQLETELLNGTIAHGGNPILEWNAQSAVVKTDDAENRKLVKASATARIDGLIALAMACGVLPLEPEEKEYTMFFV